MAIEENLEKKAQILKALGNTQRLKILRELCIHKTNVSALCEKLQIPQSSVSRHLAVLRTAGVVKGLRAGNEIDYQFECDKLQDFVKLILKDSP